MGRKAIVYALVCAATLAAEPVNQDAELTLDLLEFLAEFGDHADTVPVSEDELNDDSEQAADAEAKQTADADASTRGKQK